MFWSRNAEATKKRKREGGFKIGTGQYVQCSEWRPLMSPRRPWDAESPGSGQDTNPGQDGARGCCISERSLSCPQSNHELCMTKTHTVFKWLSFLSHFKTPTPLLPLWVKVKNKSKDREIKWNPRCPSRWESEVIQIRGGVGEHTALVGGQVNHSDGLRWLMSLI